MRLMIAWKLRERACGDVDDDDLDNTIDRLIKLGTCSSSGWGNGEDLRVRFDEQKSASSNVFLYGRRETFFNFFARRA